MPRPALFLFFLIYVGLILIVTSAFRRRLRSLEDYFLAGRALPGFLVYASLCAAWIGATSMLVSTNEAYDRGLSAFWIIGLPAVLTVLVFALFLIAPIRRLSTVTLPDLIEAHYGRLVRHLAAALIIWYMALLAASQMVAAGSFLSLFLGRPYLFSLALAASIVILYTLFGGLFTVVVTDLLHFLLLAAGIIALFLSLSARTTLPALSSYAASIGKSGYFDFFLDWKRNGLIVLSFVLAWTISPIAWQRIQAARSQACARRGLWMSAVTFALLYMLIVLVGMLSLPLFKGRPLENPLLSETVLHGATPFLAGLIFVAVLAALLSTMDTAINTGAMSLAHDVFDQILPAAGKAHPVTFGRLATLIVGLLAFLVATRFNSILKTIGLASEVMAEGLFIPGIAMLFMKKRLPAAGLLSLALGGGFAILSFASAAGLVRFGLPAWPYSVPIGLGLSLLGFFLGWLLHLSSRVTRGDPTESSRGPQGRAGIP